MVPLDDDRAARQPDPVAPAWNSAEQAERQGQIHQALAQLTPNQQEVIRLKFQDGLNYRQISEITGLSMTNVGYLIHVGIKGIRQRLAEPVTAPTGLRGDAI